MSNFTDYVEFVSTNNFKGKRRIYQLTRNLIWEIGYLGSNKCILIEKGFLTDFLSVPLGFHLLLDNDGPYAAAGALHDKLYRHLGYGNRAFADDQLYDAMVALGAWKITAFTVWAAVRMFGKKYYRNN